MLVLDESDWRGRAAAHLARVREYTVPHRERRRRGEDHPVLDFLFTYYSHRATRLERWHPGAGVVLLGPSARGYLQRPGYAEVGDGVAAAAPSARLADSVDFVRALLAATASRPARLNCFGLHEWAMVYRGEPRHGSAPLRLGAAGTDTVVESLPLRCTHHDAYRFFTDAARPRAELAPSRADQVAMEQPGCLHTSMDLYKWCYKLEPLIPSELIVDCFELAVTCREIDMRASPYDLSALGYRPIEIETPAGRAEYVREQQTLAARASELRTRLLVTLS
jgi:hypothetical protein